MRNKYGPNEIPSRLPKPCPRPNMYVVNPSLRANTNSETGESTNVVIWSYLEVYTAVICSCLIAIRPLLTEYIPSVLRSAHSSQNHASYNTCRPHRVHSESRGTLGAAAMDQQLRLNSVGSRDVWIDGESAHEEGHALEAKQPFSIDFQGNSLNKF
jgi:hypothetical protein